MTTNYEIWGPDSYEWKPERWLQPLRESVAAAHIPGIYSNLWVLHGFTIEGNSMTFLGGGRACIELKFSQLEMKVVLSVLLESFKFSPSKGAETYWHMNNVATPTVTNSGANKPQLPLIVEMAQ